MSHRGVSTTEFDPEGEEHSHAGPERLSCGVDIASLIRHGAFAVVRSKDFDVPESLKRSLAMLVPTWERLKPDKYLMDGGGYRWRGYGKYTIEGSGSIIDFSTPEYFQNKLVNSFAGGVHRSFAPLEDSVAENDFLQALIVYSGWQFSAVTGHVPTAWAVDVHQVRIVGTADRPGLPAPEGVHRDGLDFLSVHLINRLNTRGGGTVVYTPERVPLARVELDSPLDSFYADDSRVLHYTEPIVPAGDGRAVRDALLLGFRRVTADATTPGTGLSLRRGRVRAEQRPTRLESHYG